MSVEVKLFPLLKVAEFQERMVPWEVDGYAADYEWAESDGGFFDLTDWQTVAVSGPDATDYLQRMSTVNFKTFDSGQVAHGAFLTGRGQVLSLGWFQAMPDGWHVLVAPPQGPALAQHLENFHFQEKLEVYDRTSEWAVFGLWNPRPEIRVKLGMGKREIAALHLHTVLLENLRFEIWRDDSRPPLWWVKIARRDALSLMKWLHDSRVRLLGRRLFEFYRIKHAVPQVGMEASDRVILLETNFDRAVARNKGCYPGQEVIERIYTYGQVNKKLLPVEISRPGGTEFPSPPIPLHAAGKEIGNVVSYALYPNDPQRAAGLAYINRQHWEASEPFAADEGLQVALAR